MHREWCKVLDAKEERREDAARIAELEAQLESEKRAAEQDGHRIKQLVEAKTALEAQLAQAREALHSAERDGIKTLTTQRLVDAALAPHADHVPAAGNAQERCKHDHELPCNVECDALNECASRSHEVPAAQPDEAACPFCDPDGTQRNGEGARICPECGGSHKLYIVTEAEAAQGPDVAATAGRKEPRMNLHRSAEEWARILDRMPSICGYVSISLALRRDTIDDILDLSAEVKRLEEELTGAEACISLAYTRMHEASALWQKANNKPHIEPDLGNLLEWLMDTKGKAEEEARVYREAWEAWEALDCSNRDEKREKEMDCYDFASLCGRWQMAGAAVRRLREERAKPQRTMDATREDPDNALDQEVQG
jgi:ribosomal protein L37AE/L43A